MNAQQQRGPSCVGAAAGVLLAPSLAAAHGGEAALFMFGDVVAIGLVGLMCLLLRTSVVSRATAFVVGLIACVVSYGLVLRTNPAQFGLLPSFLLRLLPPILLSGIALVWGARQER